MQEHIDHHKEHKKFLTFFLIRFVTYLNTRAYFSFIHSKAVKEMAKLLPKDRLSKIFLRKKYLTWTSKHLRKNKHLLCVEYMI